MKVTFKELTEKIFGDIIPKLEKNNGISIFVKERAKFEGWLKVELCESLSKYFSTVTPEKDRIDVTFDDWTIELKTVNTNYEYKKVENKTRPITENIQRVIKDIKKLKSTNYGNKAILFIVFPVNHDHVSWRTHFQKISKLLKELEHREDFGTKLPHHPQQICCATAQRQTEPSPFYLLSSASPPPNLLLSAEKPRSDSS